MSSTERVISALLIIYVVMIGTSGLALSEDVGKPSNLTGQTAGASVPSALPPTTPVRNAIASANRVLWSALGVLPLTANSYTRTLGLTQHWAMFSNPRHNFRYAKVVFELSPPNGARTDHRRPPVIEELVLPRSRTDVAKPLVGSAFHRMKAVENAIADFRVLSLNPRALAPLARYFRSEFCSRSSEQCDRLVRTEIWSGTVTSAGGEAIDVDRPDEGRDLVVADYFDGPRLQFRAEEPRLGAAVNEPGVRWVLLYIDPPADEELAPE